MDPAGRLPARHAERRPDHPGPLRLRTGERRELDRLELEGPGRDAFAVLAACAVRFAIDDIAARSRELDQLAEICERVPIYELRRPRDLEQLALAGDLLHALVEDREGA